MLYFQLIFWNIQGGQKLFITFQIDKGHFGIHKKVLLSILIMCTLLASVGIFAGSKIQTQTIASSRTITKSDLSGTPIEFVPKEVADWYAQIGQWDENYGAIFDIDVQNGIAYLAMEMAGLLIMDISNPSIPQILGSYQPEKSDYYMCLTVVGDITFVGSTFYGLLAFDTSDPTNPMKISEYAAIGYVSDIFAQGDFVYVTRDSYGFSVFNVTDPYHLEYCKRIYPLSGYGYRALYVEENYAYVTVMDGFEIIDISDPYNPYVVSYYSEPDLWNEDIWCDGIYLYLTCYDRLLIFDITDPYTPMKIGEYYDWGECYQVVYSNDYLYING
ncbi:MAG: hypothetical protein FK734_11375, partial [Asgard group archaeon]|nr:hypothetical protein [Asgard group archaeon]